MNPPTALDIHAIRKRLPHRFPFLMIDRVLEQRPGEAVALKNISINEPYFQGHFPAEPMVPGVLIGEAMAQAAAFIGGGTDAGEPMGVRAFLTGLNLKIERPVVPGDQLIIRARLVKRLGKLMKVTAQASVGRAVVATADLTVAMASAAPAGASGAGQTSEGHEVPSGGAA